MTWLTEILRSLSKPFQWWVVVAPWEQGIRVRLGKRSKHLLPGIHFRIPFLDRVIRMCVRDRVIETDLVTVTTKDGKDLCFGLYIDYSIKDAKLVVETVARPEQTIKGRILADAIEVAAATDSADLTLRDLTKQLDPVEGITINSIQVQSFVYTRTYRLLQGQDYKYSSAVDCALDDKPATVS